MSQWCSPGELKEGASFSFSFSFSLLPSLFLALLSFINFVLLSFLALFFYKTMTIN